MRDIALTCWLYTTVIIFVETAINIGHSCRLLTDEMHDVFIVDSHEKSDVQDQLTEIKHTMDVLIRVKNGEQPTDSFSPPR